MSSPCHPSARAPSPGEASLEDCRRLPAAETATRRILVVDDSVEIRRLLETVLRGAGYLVRCAGDGEEAWEALCAERYDALVTDHDMPRLSGVGLLRRVRTGLRHLPVILISGRMPWSESDFGQLLDPGVAMEKPLSMPVFLAKVKGMLASAAWTGARASGTLPGGSPGDPVAGSA